MQQLLASICCADLFRRHCQENDECAEEFMRRVNIRAARITTRKATG